MNSQLLSLIEKGGTFWDAKKYLFAQEPYKEANLDVYQFSLNNHALVISQLFCLIVVPKEILHLPKNHPIFHDFDHKKIIELFTILEPSQLNSYLLIRCLRNSVAHALFSISENNGHIEYEFWTERKPIFRAIINHDNLIKFLSMVGQNLTNTVLQQKL